MKVAGYQWTVNKYMLDGLFKSLFKILKVELIETVNDLCLYPCYNEEHILYDGFVDEEGNNVLNMYVKVGNLPWMKKVR